MSPRGFWPVSSLFQSVTEFNTITRLTILMKTLEAKKTGWCVIGVSSQRVGVPYIYRKRGVMASFHATPEDLAAARKWKTWEGAERFIAREKAAGSNWTYALWPVQVAG